MDGARFDDLSRAFALAAPRREMLRGTTLGVLAAITAACTYRGAPNTAVPWPSKQSETDATGSECTYRAVEECQNPVLISDGGAVTECMANCVPAGGVKDWDEKALCMFSCALFREHRKTLQLINCHSTHGGCIGGTQCRRDVSRSQGGTCCPPGFWPYSGVCKPQCSKTCAHPLEFNPASCECECMLAPSTCSDFQRIDPGRCTCVCRTYPCFTGKDKEPTTCRCRCMSHSDCYECEYCDVLTGFCERSPVEFYCGSSGPDYCCLPGEYCCGGRRCCKGAEPCCGGGCWEPGWKCCGNKACPPKTDCCVAGNPNNIDCCPPSHDCCKGSQGQVQCCDREHACCRDGACVAGKC
jgi:hypothetical protein